MAAASVSVLEVAVSERGRRPMQARAGVWSWVAASGALQGLHQTYDIKRLARGQLQRDIR